MSQKIVRKGPKQKYGGPPSSIGLSVQLKGESMIDCTPLDPTQPVRKFFHVTEIEGCEIKLLCNVESKKEIILGQMKKVLGTLGYVVKPLGCDSLVVVSKAKWECDGAGSLRHELAQIKVIYRLTGLWSAEHSTEEAKLVAESMLDTFSRVILCVYPEVDPKLAKEIMTEGELVEQIHEKHPKVFGTAHLHSRMLAAGKDFFRTLWNWDGKDPKTGEEVLYREAWKGQVVRRLRMQYLKDIVGEDEMTKVLPELMLAGAAFNDAKGMLPVWDQFLKQKESEKMKE